ncbi:hypothetical protein BDV95DRAFT_583394 [Massariosphaeria phaeospora]|uniref:Uncharacterized protein n=1 Tax=Massariosphaeria phaeospora TaxID=100035 RepID=A0A7C8M439_9PLEO|nr:hypothetical protein BDV95DRAFT_583394 [Massariosphaeria phaeospora]
MSSPQRLVFQVQLPIQGDNNRINGLAFSTNLVAQTTSMECKSPSFEQSTNLVQDCQDCLTICCNLWDYGGAWWWWCVEHGIGTDGVYSRTMDICNTLPPLNFIVNYYCQALQTCIGSWGEDRKVSSHFRRPFILLRVPIVAAAGIDGQVHDFAMGHNGGDGPDEDLARDTCW